jgi:hypothetical protein
MKIHQNIPKPILLKSVVDNDDLIFTDYFKSHCRLKHLIDNRITTLYSQYKAQAVNKQMSKFNKQKAEEAFEYRLNRTKYNNKRQTMQDRESNTSFHTVIRKDTRETVIKHVTEKFVNITVLPQIEMQQTRIHSANFKNSLNCTVKNRFYSTYKERPCTVTKTGLSNSKKANLSIKNIEFIYLK